MTELSAIIFAVVVAAMIAVAAVGVPVSDLAERMFSFTSAPADFSAKFIKP